MTTTAITREMRHGPFWRAVGALVIALAFTTVQTPIYGLYQQRDGFATFVLTIIFGVYALGVVLGLWLFGHLSDTLGRRPLILVGLAAQLPALVISIAWKDPLGLSTGRVISGLGIAALTAAFNAQIPELRAGGHTRMSVVTMSIVLTVANLGGLGLGPLIGGALAQYAPLPLVLPYLAFAALIVVALLAELTTPETVAPGPRLHYRPQQLTAPSGHGVEFRGALLAAFAAFAVFGLFNSLAPTFIAGQLHYASLLLGGVATFLVFAAAASSQVAFARVARQQRLVIALVAVICGLGLLVLAVWVRALAPFLLGGALLGAGNGLLFAISLDTGGRIAPRGRESGVLATIFLAAYAGLAVPAIAVGVALEFISPAATLTGFAVLMGMLSSVAVTTLVRGNKEAGTR
jgi:Major Facilitator Superfamily